jgi:beta-N-acetylhexosaminidase
MQLDSVEQLAGQRLMVGFEGETLSIDMKYLIDTLKVGGVVLFKRNLSNPEQIKALCEDLQEHARAVGQPPLIIAIDQEGGQVARLRAPFTEFKGNAAMTREEDAIDFARITAKEMHQARINMNLAPVLDVIPKGLEGVMAGRSFGDDIHWVSKMGANIIKGLQEQGIMAVAKHFPGIGRTTLDSHLDKPTLDTDEGTLQKTDFLPFQKAVECGVAGIMLSHIEYTAIDSDWPASLSSKIVRGWLRDRLKYDGVVMTDDFDMGAICKYYTIPTIVDQVLSADIDMMLICHRSENMEMAFEEIINKSRESSAMTDQARQSVYRIMKLKEKYLSV